MSLLATRAPVLPIGALPRVDLLPPSERRRRDMLARARSWGWVVLAALAVALLAIGAAFAFHVTASVRLALEQSRTQQILADIAELSDVSTALSTRTELQTLRRDAMAGDLAWAPVIAHVARQLPAGISITEYALNAGAVPVDDADPTTAVGVEGTVTFTTPAAIDLVAATRELRASKGVLAADLSALTSAEGVSTYTVSISMDQTVYTGAFAPAASE